MINEDVSQAKVRIAYGIIGSLYICGLYLWLPDFDTEIVPYLVFIIAAHMVYAITTGITIMRFPEYNRIRRIANIIVDMSTITALLSLLGESGTIFYLLYLWVIIGNGMRFGIQYLFITLFFGIIGFSIVISYSDYWVQNRFSSIGLLLGVVILPLFFIILIRRLHSSNAALQESEEKYRRLFELSEDPMWLLIDKTLIMCNQSAFRMLGYESAEELIPIHPASLSPEYQPDGHASYARIDKLIATAFREGYHRFEWNFSKKDGEVLPVEVSLTKIPYEGGHALFSIWRDVTERKQTEIKLREREALYRSLIETTDTGYLILDGEGGVIDANQEYVRLTGHRTLQEILTRNVVEWIAEYDLERGIREVRKCIELGFVHDLQVDYVQPDGTIMPVEINARVVNTEGELKILSLCRDITERKRSEARQARLQRELQQSQKMEALGQLTGGIAHDFNNILGIIIGYSGLARSSCVSKGEAKLAEQLDHVLKASERARDLVAQMLAFSRSKALDEEPLELQPLIREDLKMLRSILPASIEINAVMEQDLPAVLLKHGQLNQLLVNLCVNARDAMEGKGNLTIRLGWASGLKAECSECHKQIAGDWVELSVTDTGSGVRPEVLERIFDPFYTTKDVGKGTGMGLSVIQGIMRNHGGHILVETERGTGTTFRLLFPPVVDATNETPGAGQSSEQLRHGQGERILVLDDELELGEFIGDLLRSHGYRTTVLTSSKQALELFHEKPSEFDLLVTDQTMPEITGVELVKAVRKIRPDLPAILNTGFSEDIDEESAARMGVRYLGKPISTDGLLQTVGDLLGQKPRETGQ